MNTPLPVDDREATIFSVIARRFDGWSASVGRANPLGYNQGNLFVSKKNVLIANFALWVVAALLHPVSELIPTGSGEPPRFFSLLFPIIFIMFAFASTTMISGAITESKTKD